MKNYIEMQLFLLRKRQFLGEKKKYYQDMVDFFLDVDDPTDLNALAARSWSNPYQPVIDKTAKLSGVNDRRTDRNGNDFWVEETTLLGDD